MSKTSRNVGVAAVLFVVFAGLLLIGWPDERTVTVVNSVVSVVVAALAAVLAALATRRASGRLRAAWLALTIGLTGAAAAAAVWAYFTIGTHPTPSLSLADAAYLLFPVGVVTSLLLFPSRRSHLSPHRGLLDGVIVAASLLIVSWLTVMQPVYAEASMSPLELVVALAYPVSNVVTLTVAIVVLARTAEGRLPMFLTLGLACMTLAEFAYAYLAAGNEYQPRHVIGLGWLAGMLLIAVGAAEGCRAASDSPRRTEKQEWASILLPYAALILAGIVVAAQPPARLSSGPVLTVGAVLVGAVLVRQFLLVAENRRLLAAKADEATRDSLTGLASRAQFQDRLQHVLQRTRRDGLATGVIRLDLCDVKLINDTLGDRCADEVLLSSAQRMLSCVRSGDTVARLGSDRFAVLLEGGVAQCELVVQRLVEAFDRPFPVGGYEFLIRLSVGIAVADTDEPNVSAEELLSRADMALDSAKVSRSGGVCTGRAELLSGDLDEDPWRQSRTPGGVREVAQLLGDLRRAIDRSELTLAYQPKFDAHTRAIVGVEALLRWPHPDRGLLTPEKFLPLVRRHLLMGGITDFVVNRALDDAVRWQTAGLDVPVAVNLFAPLLGNVNLPDKIGRALTDRGLPASALAVEITEDLFVDDMERTQTVLHELSERGIKIAIDDFGTGYSALSYLTDLPVDEVKLDRSFVARILADERAAMMVSTVIDLAHRLDLVVVAEGVENADLAARLPDLGCDILQGYYLSPPLTIDELLGLLLEPKTAVRQPF